MAGTRSGSLKLSTIRTTVWEGIARKIPAISKSPEYFFVPGYNPDLVVLQEATGGFNCVVEIAAAHCLRLFDDNADIPPLSRALSGSSLIDFYERAGVGGPSTPGPFLRPITTKGNYRARATLSPVSLEFKDPRKACVKYVGGLVLEENLGWSELPGFIGPIGKIELSICADYLALPNDQLKNVDIVADMTSAELEWGFPSNDTQAFFDRFLTSAAEGVTNDILVRDRIHLTPKISLAGRNPSNIAVSEISDFDVEVFHVTGQVDGVPLQAIVAAFDLKPGCQGLVDDVEHFIGPHDYGVISDEYLVERVLKHKWRIGGFDRWINLNKTITIERDDEPEDATLEGHMTLDTLDFVTIETDSNTRTDFVRIGGAATTTPERIRLNDGNVIRPSDTDFGDPSDNPWSMVTSLAVEPDLSDDPELRQFQERAHLDAYRHLARPFAHFPTAPDAMAIDYTRTEGVTRHIFVLGQLNTVFV